MSELWQHQQDALAFAAQREHTMLAMDMGTGKSRCVVEMIAQSLEDSGKRKCLIVCPKSVLPVWIREFRKFYPGSVSSEIADMPDALVLTPTKGTARRKVESIQADWKDLVMNFCHTEFMGIVVVNYETLREKAFTEFAQTTDWHWCVLDESHRVKSQAGTTAKAVAPIKADRKLCLTGTPMPHSLLDIFSQARFLDPRIFGTSWIAFQRRYAILGVKVPKFFAPGWQSKLHEMPEEPRAHCIRLLETKKFRSDSRAHLREVLVDWLNDKQLDLFDLPRIGPFTKAQWKMLGRVDKKMLMQVVDYKNMSEFESKLATFMFQVKADDVLDLPEKQDIVRPVYLEPKAQRLYDGMNKEFVAELADGRVSSAANALVRLLRLQQVTGGFVTVDDEDEPECVGTEKREALQELIDDMAHDEPIVVFCRFTKDIDSVREAAEASERECFELSGRENTLAEWQEATDGSVIAVQIQSGGVGISLVRARYCVYYSVGFSLGDYLQSRARVHRPGQERPVIYYHLVAQRTIDERVYRALAARKEIVDEVMTNVANATT